MDLKNFFRILRKNLVVIILFPAIIVVMVLYLSKDKKEYKSTASVSYRAAASTVIDQPGLQLFNTKSYNYISNDLINFPKYKETSEAVAIRLLAKFLMLEQPNTAIISTQNFIKLNEMIPDDVKRLVVFESDAKGIEDANKEYQEHSDSYENQELVEKTTEPVYYKVKPGDYLYSIASDYQTTIQSIKDLNPKMKNRGYLVAGERLLVKEEILIKLEETIGEDDLEMKQVPLTAFDLTVLRLTEYLNSNLDNYLYQLLHSNDPDYSIEALAKINGTKQSKSNVVDFSFVSEDPVMARQTLLVFANYLVKNYNELNKGESNITRDYYLDQADKAKAELTLAEDNLLQYKQKYRIINYYEQSRHLSIERERIANRLNEQIANYKAEKLALKDIEKKMTEKDKIIRSMKDIDALRKNIVEIGSKMTALEVAGIDSTTSESYQSLSSQKQTLEKELDETVNNFVSGKFSLEGATVNIVIREWMKHKIAYDIAKVNVQELKRRLSDYEKRIYDYSSVGANINRNKREIGILEKEYLGYLRNISQSKLSSEIALKLIDAPDYPVASKLTRKIKKAIFSGLLGLVLILLLLLFLDSIDHRIRTVERAEAFTGLNVVSVFPKVNGKSNGIDFDKVLKRVSELVIQYMHINYKSDDTLKQYNVLALSTREGEGKTFVCANIVSTLRKNGNKVLYVNALDTSESDSANETELQDEDDFVIDINSISDNSKSFEELLIDAGKNPDNYNNIFIEIPGLLYHQYPHKILSMINLFVLVCSVQSSWQKADSITLERFKTSIKSDIVTILNKADKMTLKSILGYLPKKKN